RKDGTDDRQEHNDWVYDPQLNLAINDPRTGLPLWAITEHIEPAGTNKEANNRHFDEAVTRLVDDLKRLNLTPPDLTSAAESIALPPGAIAAAERQSRERHAGAGMLLGGAIGALLSSRVSPGPCDGFAACSAQGSAKMRAEIFSTVGGVLAGAFVGWFWPVHF